MIVSSAWVILLLKLAFPMQTIRCYHCLGTTQITGSSSQATGQPSTTGSSGTTEISTGSQGTTPGTQAYSSGTTTGSEGTPLSSQTTTASIQGTTTAAVGTSTSSQGTPSSNRSTKEASRATTTTGTYCDEIEYIDTLIATDSVQTQPDDITDKQDLIKKGVDFTYEKPSFVINVPNGGAIVRDIVVYSSNVDEIEVVFTTESGHGSTPIRGAPTSLPTKEFPTEKVTEIVIKVKKTTDNNGPKDVTLSIIACTEAITTTTAAGIPTKETHFF
jgi:hypothetical protein